MGPITDGRTDMSESSTVFWRTVYFIEIHGYLFKLNWSFSLGQPKLNPEDELATADGRNSLKKYMRSIGQTQVADEIFSGNISAESVSILKEEECIC